MELLKYPQTYVSGEITNQLGLSVSYTLNSICMPWNATISCGYGTLFNRINHLPSRELF